MLSDGVESVRGRVMKVASEELERREEVASNEEGFVGEGEGVKMVKSEKKEGRGGEEGGEKVVPAVGERENRVGEI